MALSRGRPGREGRVVSRRAALWPVAVGIGWRPPHYREVTAQGADGIDFLEVHSEHFLAPGGVARQVLLEAACHHPISLHGVGLGLGSAAGIDWLHLGRLRTLIEELRPAVLSEHASFCRVQRHEEARHAHAQLPIPFSARGLALLAAQVDTVQQVLGRQLLIENLAAYVAWEENHLSEPAFLNALADRTGCGLLLDLNNLFVNALNHGLAEAEAVLACQGWLDEIDAAVVGQFHLAGHTRLEGLVVDDHGGPVAEPVWTLYRHALAGIGARPTLIEWDQDLPPLAGLVAEVDRARREQAALGRLLIAPPPPRPNSRKARAAARRRPFPEGRHGAE